MVFKYLNGIVSLYIEDDHITKLCKNIQIIYRSFLEAYPIIQGLTGSES